jgi:hypothetical protein
MTTKRGALENKLKKALLTALYLLVLLLAATAPSGEAQAFEMPPEIQAIMSKAQSGTPLSVGEVQKLVDWQEGMIDEQIRAMKESGMDKETLEPILAQLEDARKEMRESLLGSLTRQGSVTQPANGAGQSGFAKSHDLDATATEDDILAIAK